MAFVQSSAEAQPEDRKMLEHILEYFRLQEYRKSIGKLLNIKNRCLPIASYSNEMVVRTVYGIIYSHWFRIFF